MRFEFKGISMLVKLGTVFTLIFGMPAFSNSRTQTNFTEKDVAWFVKSLSNWERWGKEDQRGAINLITPEKRKKAAALVKEGESISLAHNVIKEKMPYSVPFEHRMVETGFTEGATGASDAYSIQYHGYTQTHLDALCHFFHQGRMYNGFSQQDVTDKGAGSLSVIAFKSGIFTRGVLVDFPRLFGVEYLKGSRAIYPEDLRAWEERTGVKIGSGDAVLFRMGSWARQRAEGPWDFEKDSPGLHISCVSWLKKRDVAIIGSDLALDVLPSGVEGVNFPVHMIAIVGMGIPVLDNCDLEALGEAAAKHKRWDFLFAVNPLPVEGGTGSPVNPIATF